MAEDDEAVTGASSQVRRDRGANCLDNAKQDTRPMNHEQLVLRLNDEQGYSSESDMSQGEFDSEGEETPESTTLHLWDEDSDEGDERPRSRHLHTLNPFIATHALPSVAKWWKTLLIGSAEPGTLSTGHVAMNMLGSSLHPGVLLAMPVYFTRAGVLPGMIAVVFIAILSAFGSALWITLGRYVGGSTIEAVTSRAFGMNTQWKRNLGMGLSSIMMILYCGGAAVVSYHAMTDLLLQVSMNYAKPGILFHDRAFVTLVIGGLMTLPLLITATPKRNIIQIQSWVMVLCYPAVALVLFLRIKDWDSPYEVPNPLPPVPVHLEPSPEVLVPMPHFSDYTWPWASTGMVPLLLLSALPTQILAHSRSLYRKTVYDSNVRSFFFAQVIQTICMLLIVFVIGAQIGMFGSQHMQMGLHANFFDSLPSNDDQVNVARMFFVLTLAAHLSVCLASARSSWSRLLNLFKINPLRSVQPPTPQRRSTTPRRRYSGLGRYPVYSPRTALPRTRSSGLSFLQLDSSIPAEERAWRRFKFLRRSLSGIVLWGATASIAYSSGVGGVFLRKEREGEELRFLRSVELIGILGSVAGFLLPAIIWLVLFRVRRPRAILMFQTQAMRRRIQNHLLSPLSAMIPTAMSEEQESLLRAEHQDPENPDLAQDSEFAIPNHRNEEGFSSCDEATLALLARKERALQRQTRERRLWQELIVVAFLLPFGLFLVVSSGLELLEGGY
ncbi:hypothetical protein MYAM1_001895 [Malassezia yamatoensis]|uniref:Amino acid transporter transmembrane domain-containing protein n=1 Tax=Malassezia yamatoensis TaxID=253288 RepID=A0AAJ5YR68_9BASI|nr:hypothetical protein MYAM1_001895 [Malassezia yamatoensis]